MSLSYAAFGGGVIGATTAAANTAWAVLIPSYHTANTSGYTAFTRLCQLSVTDGNTANNLYVLRPIGRTTVAAAVNSGVNAVVLTADPSPASLELAAGHYVALQLTNGVQQLFAVSAWNSTTFALTLNTNTTAAVAAGNRFWMFGAYNSTDPATGSAFPYIPTTANTATTFSAVGAGFVGAQVGDPLLIYNPNATAASTLNYAEFGYSKE